MHFLKGFSAVIVFSLLFAFNASSSFGAPKALNNFLTTPEAPVSVAVSQARRLFIVGFQGSVTVQPISKSSGEQVVVKATKYINADDLAPGDTEALTQLTIKTSNLGDTVEVRAQLPPTAGDWARWAQGKRVPSAHLDILAPDTMNLEIYLTRGDVKVTRWKAPVLITSQEGKISAEDIAGDVTIHGMYGAIKVGNIKGNVAIENFTSQVAVENIAGKLHLKNFAGDTHVKRVEGAMNLSSQKGGLFTQDTVGAMEVQTGIAAIHIADHKGALSGHSDSGAINAHLIGPIDARLRSNSGPLNLVVPRNADAIVSMYSAKGTLAAPSSLESKRSPSGKSVHGNLGGGEGHIRMSTETGDLSLKL